MSPVSRSRRPRSLTALVTLLALLAPAPLLAEPTLAERLCAAYGVLTNVSCSIRKDTVSGLRHSRMLSRVHYQTPDRIHVDNTAPARRRIVCDGATLYYHDAALPKGFSRPVAQLDPDWLVMLRTVPGSPMEHLLRLKGVPEKALPATTEAPVRRGYETPAGFVVLSCDTSNRLARLEFFATPSMESRSAVYDYSGFEEVAPACWIPRLHKAVLTTAGVRVEETRRLDALVVNQPPPPGLFDPAVFFQGVEFVPDFADMNR